MVKTTGVELACRKFKVKERLPERADSRMSTLFVKSYLCQNLRWSEKHCWQEMVIKGVLKLPPHGFDLMREPALKTRINKDYW